MQIFLRDNKLKTLPSEFGDLKRLREVNLQGNELAYLPPEIGHIDTLLQEPQYFKLAGNPFIDELVNVLQKSLKITFEYMKSDNYKYAIERHM